MMQESMKSVIIKLSQNELVQKYESLSKLKENFSKKKKKKIP